MIGLDTNVLVRYFAQDDALQSPLADRFIGSLSLKKPGWVSQGALLELVWVMTSLKRKSKREVLAVLDVLSADPRFVLHEQASVAEALELFRKGRADFADCLIAASARHAGCTRTATFDGVAARDAGMELLG